MGSARGQSTPCLGEHAGARSGRRRGYVVHHLKRGGGFGNKLTSMWRSLEVAVLLDRTLWVHMEPSIHQFITPDTSLRGLVRWEVEPPPAQKLEPVRYDRLIPSLRHASSAAHSLHLKSHITLTEVSTDFPGWHADDAGFLPSLPCLAARLLRPAPLIEAEVDALLNR